MKNILNNGLFYTLGGLIVVSASVVFSLTELNAQPSCYSDCMNNDCCAPGQWKPCNGGDFAGICPDACVGASYEQPIGSCL